MLVPTLRVMLQVATAVPAPPVDHAPFDSLLRRHVAEGLVDYAAFERSPAFAAYLDRLAATDPAALPRDEQLALWINAYNAATIRLILDHGERRSIRRIARDPWAIPVAIVGGRRYTLDDIEHGVIRPTFAEPRIHFALVCAALGCPPLRPEAYTGARLEAQLDDQARRFLTATPGKNRVDVATGTVFLSPIFRFRDYERDFGGSRRAVAAFIARYHPPGPGRTLLERGTWRRWVYTPYDWALNARAGGQPSSANQRRKAPRAAGVRRVRRHASPARRRISAWVG